MALILPTLFLILVPYVLEEQAVTLNDDLIKKKKKSVLLTAPKNLVKVPLVWAEARRGDR